MLLCRDLKIYGYFSTVIFNSMFGMTLQFNIWDEFILLSNLKFKLLHVCVDRGVIEPRQLASYSRPTRKKPGIDSM